MKRTLALIIAALSLTACHKDPDDPKSSGPGRMSVGGCAPVVTIYEGAVQDNTCTVAGGDRCQNFNQDVAVNVNPAVYPYDKAEVYGCTALGACREAPLVSWAQGSSVVTLVNWWELKINASYLFTDYKIVATQCR